EILDYEDDRDVKFDYVFHASGTGTTQAGLVCGHILNKDDKNIVGISVARKNPYGGKVVLDSVNDYLHSIGENSITDKELKFIDDYIIDGYGTSNEEVLEIIEGTLINDGIPLDKTYTGKAFWGMKEFI